MERHIGQPGMLQPTNFSVLMVDDTTAIREAIARSLARRGCRVTTATNGVEALEILRKQSFDVIITDLNMPDRGGLWLWRQALVVRPELRGRFVLVAPVEARMRRVQTGRAVRVARLALAAPAPRPRDPQCASRRSARRPLAVRE